jgi:alcohol dehydrogenase
VRPFDAQLRTRIVFGAGSLARLGDVARELGCRRTLLVTDAGLIRAGHARAAERLLDATALFTDFDANPDSYMVERGRAFAAQHDVDSIVGLGGGSAMDCAKAINFLLTNGGRVQDYQGYGKAARPLLPMIGVPTTTGTGSEAQSYALISDAATHRKMACGDPKAAFRVAILDPVLAVSQPSAVRAQAGYDAISHAIETWVTTKRNAFSDCFSREAWRLLNDNFEGTLARPDHVEHAGEMLLGAHYAGIAIEHSMLGATHACANPLTAQYGTAHGAAIAALLPTVVQWNADVRYRQLYSGDLAARLTELRAAAGLPAGIREAGARYEDLPRLAEHAAEQWTGRFNPRPFDAAGALEVYRCAW